MVLFPIFLECKEWTLDPHWESILTNCANGIFPKGMKIGKDCFIVNKDTFPIVADSLENFKTLMNIFKNKLSLSPKKNTKPEILDIYNKLQQEYDKEWRFIKIKKIKQDLLLKFVVECKQKYNLSLDKTKKLLALVNIALLIKTLDSDDISYSDGKIHSIKGLIFENNDFVFNEEYDGYQLASERLVSGAGLDKISQVLDRYIKDYKNQLIKI